MYDTGSARKNQDPKQNDVKPVNFNILPPNFILVMPTKLSKELVNMNVPFQVVSILWDVEFESKKPAFTKGRKYDNLDVTLV